MEENIMTFKDFKETETFKKSLNTEICINDGILLDEDEFGGLVVDL